MNEALKIIAENANHMTDRQKGYFEGYADCLAATQQAERQREKEAQEAQPAAGEPVPA